ncbi:MAG: hypothetical protein R3C40_05170 [Parvularculaceae bacterium]
MTSDEEKRWELWLHWARMPAWSHHEASALIAGIIPSEKWSYDGLYRKHYSFGEELNTRYFRIRDLLLREETTYRVSFPIELPELLSWAKRARIDISDKFVIALCEMKRLPVADEEPVEPDSASTCQEAQDLGARERDTLLYLIGSMAVSKYGFTPKSVTAATAILKDMTSIGLEALSVETIRNKLKDASDLIPQSYFSEKK